MMSYHSPIGFQHETHLDDSRVCHALCGVADPFYVGCLQATRGTTGQNLTFIVRGATTGDSCKAEATASGYAYAAVIADTCYGGDDISLYTSRGTCTTPCSVDTTQICGGPNSSYSIFYTKGTGKVTRGWHQGLQACCWLLSALLPCMHHVRIPTSVWVLLSC